MRSEEVCRPRVHWDMGLLVTDVTVGSLARRVTASRQPSPDREPSRPQELVPLPQISASVDTYSSQYWLYEYDGIICRKRLG